MSITVKKPKENIIIQDKIPIPVSASSKLSLKNEDEPKEEEFKDTVQDITSSTNQRLKKNIMKLKRASMMVGRLKSTWKLQSSSSAINFNQGKARQSLTVHQSQFQNQEFLGK